VIGLTSPPGAVQEAALGWPEYGEAPIMRGFFAYGFGSLRAAPQIPTQFPCFLRMAEHSDSS
jgi:hypothetical protein